MSSKKSAIIESNTRQDKLYADLLREIQLSGPLSKERALYIARLTMFDDEKLINLFASMLRFGRVKALDPEVIDAMARRKVAHSSKRLMEAILMDHNVSRKTLDYIYDSKKSPVLPAGNWSLVVMFASHPNTSNRVLHTMLNKALLLNDALGIAALAPTMRSHSDINRIWEYARNYESNNTSLIRSLAENPNLPRKIRNTIIHEVKTGKYKHDRGFARALAGNYSLSVKTSLSLIDYVTNLTSDDYDLLKRNYFFSERVSMISNTAKFVFDHPRMHVATLISYLDNKDVHVKTAEKNALISRLDDIPAYLASLGMEKSEFDVMTPEMIKDLMGLN
jgi:hypothetical protein